MDGANNQAQPTTLLKQLRYKRKALKLIAQRISSADQLLLAETLTIARSNHVRCEQDAVTVVVNFIHRYPKIRVGLVDRQPGRKLEESAQLRVGGKWRAVIDQLPALTGINEMLIGQTLSRKYRTQTHRACQFRLEWRKARI